MPLLAIWFGTPFRLSPCARSAAPARQIAAAVAMNRLLTRMVPSRLAAVRCRRVWRIREKLEVAAVGHLQLLREATVGAITRGQRNHRQLVARLQPAAIGAAQARAPKSRE